LSGAANLELSSLKKSYPTTIKAFEDTEQGKIVGFIHFSSSFTNLLPILNDEAEDDNTDNGSIHVYLGMSSFQEASMIRKHLYDTYSRFMQRTMRNCGKSKTAGTLPMHLEPLFGSLDFDFKIAMQLGFFLM
jgi:hypothetical protein